MKFQRRHWSYKKISLILTFCLVFYVILSCRYNKYQIDTIIRESQPQDVWEYVADFSKMKILNPTILNFKISADTTGISNDGYMHDWKYKVHYTEKLSHWPWTVLMEADFLVRRPLPHITGVPVYLIKSVQKACFLNGFYCLQAQSDFKFNSRGNDTYCLEEIQYQCPPFLGGICRRELEYQRKAVMHNLTMIFSKKQSHLVF